MVAKYVDNDSSWSQNILITTVHVRKNVVRMILQTGTSKIDSYGNVSRLDVSDGKIFMIMCFYFHKTRNCPKQVIFLPSFVDFAKLKKI